jgi:hypothetical protein
MSNLNHHLSKIFWPDSQVKKYEFDFDKDMFILTIEDYQRVSWSIRFDSVDFNFVNDPVYISDAKFSELNELNIAEFSDDDGLIIKIIYGNCAVVCL